MLNSGITVGLFRYVHGARYERGPGKTDTYVTNNVCFDVIVIHLRLSVSTTYFK
jgi:hypothetical protein